MINSLYSPFAVGGAEKSVEHLARTLVRRGHEVHVATLNDGTAVSAEELDGVHVHRLPLSNSYWPFTEVTRSTWERLTWHRRDQYNTEMAQSILDLAKRIGPQVVHSNNLAGFSVAVWGGLRGAGYRVIHTPRDYYLLCPASNMFKAGRNCAGPCFTCGLFARGRIREAGSLNGVVAASQAVLDRHLQAGCFLGVADLRVIPNGIALRPPREPLVLDGTLRLGIIGQLRGNKGIEDLITACRSLPRRGWELIVAGRGEAAYVDRLKAQAVGLPIRFAGFVPGSELLQTIHALVLPSIWHEPLSRSMIEAHANGVPVIGSMRGGTPEYLRDGVDGLLYDPNVDGALAHALSRALGDPHALIAMRPACLAAAAKYDEDVVAQAYEAAYGSAIDGR